MGILQSHPILTTAVVLALFFGLMLVSVRSPRGEHDYNRKRIYKGEKRGK